MIKKVTIAKSELDALEARAERLAREKSHLQLLMHLMNRLSEVPGLDTMIETMLQTVLDTIGGSNLILTYLVEGELFTVDVFGSKGKLLAIADPFVKQVFETGQFIEFEHDFKDTKMLTHEFTHATTWVVPLKVGDEIIGVLKMENLHIAARDLQSQFPAFFSYAALLLKNQIAGYLRMAKAEEQIREKESLLREIHHRVRNNLQVVTSLLSLQAQSVPENSVKELFRENSARVRSMSLVHERFYSSPDLAEIDFGDCARDIISDVTRRLRVRGVACRIEVEKIPMGVDMAIPCGLLFKELVTNAFKHGFAGGEGGTLTVILHRLPDQHVKIVVSDDGAGFPRAADFRKMTSMGMTLIVSLIDQLSGTVTMDNSSGTRWEIVFPL